MSSLKRSYLRTRPLPLLMKLWRFSRGDCRRSGWSHECICAANIKCFGTRYLHILNYLGNIPFWTWSESDRCAPCGQSNPAISICMNNGVLFLWQRGDCLIQHGVHQGGIGTAADCPIYNQAVKAVDDRGKIQLTFWKSELRNIRQPDYRQDPSHRPEVAAAATEVHLRRSFLPCSQWDRSQRRRCISPLALIWTAIRTYLCG